MAKILYISYDGILEPLGQSQVLAYLKQLVKDNTIHLISFEKADDWAEVTERNRIANDMAAVGILWHPLRYHKWPSALATAWDIIQGIGLGLWLVVRHRLHIVHARSYVPSVMALTLKRLTGMKYIFDMRGFWADERVDGGLWPRNGRMYRLAKWFEREFLLNADYVVSLTHAAVDEMDRFPYLQKQMPRFAIITTCADLEVFRPSQNNLLPSPIERPFTLGYVGSAGTWYLFDETLRCFQILRERLPNARLHILNRGGHDYIRERMIALNVDHANVQLKTATPVEVTHAMQEMDAGIFIIKPVYSKKASAPTKLAEFLGCGVPCLGNSGVGDLVSILEKEQVGVALSHFDDAAMREAVDRLLHLTQTPNIKAHCREVALRYFSLDDGVGAYRKVYDELMGDVND